jgi:hypothetical protein
MTENIKSDDVSHVLNKSVHKAACYLALTEEELSQIVGLPCIHQNTKEWECALLFLRLVRSLEMIIGDDPQQLREWLYHHNHHLGNKPIEMIKSFSGLNDVVIYLYIMRGQCVKDF